MTKTYRAPKHITFKDIAHIKNWKQAKKDFESLRNQINKVSVKLGLADDEKNTDAFKFTKLDRKIIELLSD